MATIIEKAAPSTSRFAWISKGANLWDETTIGPLPYNKEAKDKGPLLKTPAGKFHIPLDPYGKPSLIKCYRCQGIGHKSNVCPQRRGVNFCERYDEELEVPFQEEQLHGDEEAFADDGVRLVCVLYRVYLTLKAPEDLHRQYSP